MTTEPPDPRPPQPDATRTATDTAHATQTISPYRLLQRLGEGGMGEVWLAEQTDPVHRQVAFKVIKAGMDTRQVIARFEAERQALALMDHPAIATVFDGGSTPDGRPYFAMEYVKGEPITTYCDRQRLSTEERLELFMQVCEGVQHAHQKGVIHRDLKPSNVLVMVQDDHPVPKIIDFGVAKAIAQPLTERSLFTELGVLIGTPEYMSPEQAEMTGLDIDTRTDVYALGVMLYELLTGALPFDRKTLREGGLDEVRRTIREKTPPKPSTRVTQLGPASTEAATNRHTEPTRLASQLRGDLDWITLKALEKDRTRRYATANALAADVRRHLNHEPVSAGPPSTVYRTRKFVRRHRFGVSAGATLVLLLVAFAVAIAVAVRMMAPPVQRDPISVVIADFTNRSGDATFDGALEPMFKLALEGAAFISAYDRTAIRNLGVRPVEKLDERAALELAVKQGVNVVISGSLDRQGNRFGVSVRAIQTVTGKEITTQTQRASNKTEVLKAVATLATSVREALGDETTSDAAKRFALESLSATSLDAVHEYARGLENLSASRFEDALQKFSRAVELDPNFGGAYGGLASASYNLDRRQDAEKYLKAALDRLDSMTERERYRTRGFYYLITDDYPACVKEYGDLIARYPADASARNNRSVCLSHLRNIPAALEDMRQAVRILPNRALYQQNLAEYLVSGSDFPAGEKQARSIKEPGLFALLALASAQVGQGRVSDAEDTFRELGKADEPGASYASSGLAAVATYEGRFSDAAGLLTQGAAADLASKDTDRAADKFVALAHVELLRGRQAEAIAAADEALANSQSIKIRFLAGRVFVEGGATNRALNASKDLTSALQAASQAYGNILTGLMALTARDVRRAVLELTEANNLLDTWIGHFDLGRAYLEAGAFLQADSEFERCFNRRGEALSLFLDNEPTYGYLPLIYYYQGRVREGLKSTRAGESYQAYLDIRGKSTEDPLVPEVRRRAAAGGPR